ncbi:MAG: hypothetical protein V1760_03435 [Candidatus Peregrinibacteria bacterium]
MTNEEFLKMLGAYQSVLDPQTLEAFKTAIESGRFEPEAQIFILEELRRKKSLSEMSEGKIRVGAKNR